MITFLKIRQFCLVYKLITFSLSGNSTVVLELLKTDYPHEAKNQDGQTAVHLASMTGQDDILGKLIKFGASVNLRDSAGYTPLHYACQNNFPTTVSIHSSKKCN